jgi:fibronectin type 3 domain-containing protein/predicted small lipoprotein YifL
MRRSAGAMRLRYLIALAGLLTLSGCGYVGPIVPPSPMIPVAVSDLTVVEHGDQLVIAFTPPLRTTDEFAIPSFSNWDLRIGTGTPDTGKQYEIPVKAGAVQYSVPAADWAGQHVTIAVRTSVKKDKNYSAWSNPVSLNVVSPLKAPVLQAEATAQGYKLTWQDDGEGVHYDVFRKGPGDPKFIQIGTAEKPEFVDGTAQWNVPYSYQVTARGGSAESLPSDVITQNHPDTFAPAVPSGLATATTGDAVELSWDRNTEPDLKGYYVYRSTGGGAFTRVSDLTVLPTFSDHTVEHGKTYSYRVSAIDQTGNESEQSPEIPATFP